MGKYRFELECKTCAACFEHPAKGDIEGKTARDALISEVIVCPGNKETGQGPHLELTWEGKRLEITERFNLLGVIIE